MSQGTCMSCFSVTRVLEIKNTHLQKVFEELSNSEIQANSHPLCYICYAKLLQCQQLLKQIQDNNTGRQQEGSLVHLCISNNAEKLSLPQTYVEIELVPIKEEYISEEDVKSDTEHCVLQPNIRIECIKEEYVADSPDERSKHIPGGLRTQDDSKVHACDVCSKTFTRSSNLRTHKLVHTGQKPYSCEVCNKSFAAQTSLRKHKIMHEEKSHICDICNRTFTRNSHLKIHRMIHTGQKPYSCDICGKTFNQTSNLRMHKISHKGEKPYSCDVCYKTFTAKSSVKKHKLTHSVKKPDISDYRCYYYLCKPASS